MSAFVFIQCDGCNRSPDRLPEKNSKSTLFLLRAALRKIGWSADRQGHDYCPDCIKKRAKDR